ncbi:MAG: hypothetical protein HOQ41_03350 [Ensifer adhaerens]|nr:hypothetical protein [Ensifer adhaerens]
MAEDDVRPSADDAAMVDGEEHGLAPAVLIADALAQRRSLTDEMARLHVPGVSIAFEMDFTKVPQSRRLTCR